MFERYVVYRHGRLSARHTPHAIRAVGDGMDVYLFNHEAQVAGVEVLHGGRVGTRHKCRDSVGFRWEW